MALQLDHIAPRTRTSLNVGGLTKRLWAAVIEDFDTIAVKDEMDDPAATNSTIVEISDDHTFSGSNGFIRIPITRDSGTLETTNNAERDTNGQLQTLKARTPGMLADTIAKFEQLQNADCIVLAEMFDGKIMQIGSKRSPAEVKYKFMSGNNESGYRGLEFEVKGFETTTQVYTGTITEKS